MINETLDGRLNKSWKRKRLTTFLVYTLQYFVASVELSLCYSTSWIYLNEVSSNSENVETLYGLLHTSSFLPSVLFINVITYYADKYRKIKIIILITNFIAMIGCVIYMFAKSPWFLIIGRFLIGFHLTIRPLMVGEMARSYDLKDFNVKMQIFRGIYVFGKAAGPSFALMFLNTNFHIYVLHIRYANIAAVMALGLLLLIQILVLFLVHDLSKEYDKKEGETMLMKIRSQSNISGINLEELSDSEKTTTCNKAYIHKVANTKTDLKKVYEKSASDEYLHNTLCESLTGNKKPIEEGNNITILALFFKMLKDKDVAFLMCVTLVEEFIVQMMVLIIPVIILKHLQYSKSTVNYILAAQLVGFLILFILFYFAKFKEVHNAIIGWFLAILFSFGALIVQKSFGYIINFSILTICLTFIDIFGLNIRVFCSVSLAALVQSKYQSFIDGIRTQFHFIGCVIGSLLAGISIGKRYEVCISICVVCGVAMIVTLIRRKRLLNLEIRI